MGTLRFFEEVVSFKIRRTFGFADYTCGILYLFLTRPCDGNNSCTPQKQLNYIKHNYPTRYGRRLLLLPVFRPLISNLY